MSEAPSFGEIIAFVGFMALLMGLAVGSILLINSTYQMYGWTGLTVLFVGGGLFLLLSGLALDARYDI